MKNPHDGRFKILAEDHPELLLRLLGVLRPGAIEILDVLRELQMDPVQIDRAYKLITPDGIGIIHLEVVTSWDSKRIETFVLYRFLLKRKFKLPVESYLVFMAEKYAPKTLPEFLTYREDDGTTILTPYSVIRLWEQDPALAFEPVGRALLPWVPLLKGGLDEMTRACEAIADLRSRLEEAPYAPVTMASTLGGLASLRYDRGVLSDFLERMRGKMTLSTDLFKESWLFQDGETTGQLRALRRSIRTFFEQRFPDAGPCPALDHFIQVETLDRVFARLIEARTSDEALAAILRA